MKVWVSPKQQHLCPQFSSLYEQIGLLSNQLGNLGTPGDTGPLGEYGIMILLPGVESDPNRVSDLSHFTDLLLAQSI